MIMNTEDKHLHLMGDQPVLLKSDQEEQQMCQAVRIKVFRISKIVFEKQSDISKSKQCYWFNI